MVKPKTPSRARKATKKLAKVAVEKLPVRPRIELCREGIRLHPREGEPETLPLRAGAVHYFRLEPSAWRPALQSLVSMGFRFVETYIPWQVHESGGEGEPPRYHWEGRHDVRAFLREAQALGLHAIVRPGPHINAELTDFGLPERIVWSPDCQARSPRGNPVLLPVAPRAFPVPSYASEAFLRETETWLAEVAAQLEPLVWPEGPIVLAQIDNEGAMYFRDGAYDQDYHPDAITQYRELLRARYKNREALARAHGTPQVGFDDALPPVRYDARDADDLPRHLDWVAAQESMLARAFSRMRRALVEGGLTVPTFHNLPPAESATPLHPARIRLEGGIDLVALDYYHQAGDHRAILRRTTELAATSDGLGVPAFGAEMGAGAPPYVPPLDERDARFTLLTALAYGLRGFNLYMAVDRDRWLGAPVDRHGHVRPFASFFADLSAAMDRVRFPELVRHAPARLIAPRGMRRLARIMHAFGPASQTLFRMLGGGVRETVVEDDVDFGEGHLEAPPFRTARILVTAERALEEEGIPWALADGGDPVASLKGARWILVPTSCGVGAELVSALHGSLAAGAHVSFAPAPPRRDDHFLPLSPKTRRGLPDVPVLVGDDALDVAVVRHHVRDLIGDVPRVHVAESPCGATVHHDAGGSPRVLFVINPSPKRQRVVVQAEGIHHVRDLLDGTLLEPATGLLVDGCSVRFCAVE